VDGGGGQERRRELGPAEGDEWRGAAPAR